MKRFVKNVVLFVLIMVIALPSNVMASMSDYQVERELTKGLKSVDKLGIELTTEEWDDNDEVRVIVEMYDEPIIKYATQKGVHVGELDQGDFTQKNDEMIAFQEEVISSLKASVPEMEIHQQFVNVFNGFSTTVHYSELEIIAENMNIKSVNIANVYERPEPQMTESDKLTEASYAWDTYGYTGEGMVVAIIDTGIDPSHRDFVIDDDVTPALTEADITDFIGQPNSPLLGLYRTEKVPYGYNYADGNQEIRDLGEEASMHGMHVSGTVAANGDTDNGGIKGLAPNAQLLALKVFSNNPDDPYAYADTIIAAIEDGIYLGADVMNLSLGSTAAYVDETDPEQMAVTNAVQNGIIMSISAGNSAMFGNGYDLPYAENPDVGVVGAPGLTAESLQVASIDNFSFLYETTVAFDGLDADVLGYGKDAWDNSAPYSLVAIGGTKLGEPGDYDGIDVTGKVVLVSRGAYSFYDKTMNAAAAGAAGIIVYDHGLSTFYKNQGGWGLPFMKISKEDGLALEALLETAGEVAFTVNDPEDGKYVNPTTGQISDFSSWGATPVLGFKPEIAAPGGGIYSTLNEDSYGFMSGTSMAAPHVSGGSALMVQRIENDPIFSAFNTDVEETALLMKNILMNTAVPVMDSYGYGYTTPRAQGAGAMNIRLAMETDVVAKDPTTGVAKVNLGELNSNVLTFDVELTNYGGSIARYEPQGVVQGMIHQGGYNYLVPAALVSTSSFEVDGTPVVDYIDVNPLETVTVSVEITVDPEEIAYLESGFVNGYFLDGFVIFYTDDTILDEAETTTKSAISVSTTGPAVDNDYDAVTLSVPFMGFMGDWSDAPAFDVSVYDDITLSDTADVSNPVYSYYGATGLLFPFNNSYYYLGDGKEHDFSGDTIAISPDSDGFKDVAIPIFSLLRNLLDMSFKIEDEAGNTVVTMLEDDYFIKNFYDRGLYPEYYLDAYTVANCTWDGTDGTDFVAEGQYYYVIDGYLNDGVSYHELAMPIKVDVTAPVITDVQVTTGAAITVTTESDFSGVASYLLIDADTNDVLLTSTDAVIDITELGSEMYNVILIVEDHAGNMTVHPNLIVLNDKVVKEVRIKNGESATLYAGSNLKLDVDAVLNDGTVITELEGLTLTSSNNKVQVYENMYAKAITAGSAVVTANYKGITDTITINVLAKAPEPSPTPGPSPQPTPDPDPIVDPMPDPEDGGDDGDDGAGDEQPVVEVEASVQEDDSSATATFSGDELAAAGEEGGSAVIETEMATVEIGADTLLEDTEGKSVQLKVEKVDTLPEGLSDEDKAKVEGKTVYDFGLFIDNEKVSEFNSDDPIKITVPYELGPDEDPDMIVVYYIDDEGNLVQVTGSYDAATGTVTFETDHFSLYTIVEETVLFTDLDEVAWARNYVEYLAVRNVVEGVSETTFAPKQDVTREEYISMIIRAYGLVDEDATCTFTDVAEDAKFYQELATAEKLGVTLGIGNGEFGYGQQISREQMATIVYRALEVLGETLPVVTEKSVFNDDTDIATYAKLAVYEMQKAGIIVGEGNGIYNPDSNATKAEASKIVYYLMEIR